jgi:N-acetylmuramoyl-L-alanine amidase-like protein
VPDALASHYSRREVLTGAALLIAAVVGSDPPVSATPRSAESRIRLRDAWARELAPTGPLAAEPDVRFLLVHHSDTPNGYSRAAVPELLRKIYAFHTERKHWPDVAYNFFVDAYGGVWEGRQGSAHGPVAGSATGGSQGFAQLICFLGNRTSTPPTPAARRAAVDLLAWLGERYAIDTSPGAMATFRSRGSNRWPAGTDVRVSTIAGHRDVSMTTCPGDVAYRLVTSEFPAAVTTVRKAEHPQLCDALHRERR